MPVNPIVVEGLFEILTRWLSRKRKVKEFVLPLIQDADGNVALADNHARREWVLKQLMEKGLSESESLALVLAGVKVWRKMQEKLAKKRSKAK